ncbi:hypothetical protein GFH48_06495 [Streptomyces fagopyri]|uniref:VCBS repeat-containing protein n=1 Tax=Streptomyces fagopyri TaxID=2662397 RepID=A0A5Q0L779_9ACTN|nr:FG-GAP repeat protein [Streptomyces fagopyri]QFZ72955.1 hypothetical protein GFH48_06495 [Streptomyces fagopyri]
MFSPHSYIRWAGPLTVGLIALGVGPPGATGVAAAAPTAPVGDDFNGDGYQDVAVAASHATVDGKSGAGYVTVMYGGPHGLSASGRTVISRATKGIPGSPAKNENFGTPSAKGDDSERVGAGIARPHPALTTSREKSGSRARYERDGPSCRRAEGGTRRWEGRDRTRFAREGEAR